VSRSNGTAVEGLYQNPDPRSNPGGIAVDALADRIFFTVGSGVMAARLDGSEPTIILTGEFPMAVAVDPTTRTLYWADNGTDTIARAAYDGSNAQVLYRSDDAFSNPTSVAIDTIHRTLYWAETGAVKSSSLDGSNPHAVAAAQFATGVAVDALHEALYFSDNGDDTIRKAKLDGSSATVIYQSLDRFSNPRHVFVAP
jgi:hypothetical protein